MDLALAVGLQVLTGVAVLVIVSLGLAVVMPSGRSAPCFTSGPAAAMVSIA